MYMYEILSAQAKEAVSEGEFSKTLARVRETLDNFSDHGTRYDDASWSTHAIATNLCNWAENKAPKIKAMKAHPNYNPDEPFKIVHEVDAVRELDMDEINNFIESYNNYRLFKRPLLSSLLNIFRSTFIEQDDIETFNRLIGDVDKMVKEAEIGYRVNIFSGDALPDFKLYYAYYPSDESEIFINDGHNIVREHGILITTELVEKIKRTCNPHEGQKVSKFARKLITTIAGTVDEKAFAMYANALNPTVFKRKAVFSVDPVDYLLASNGNSWSSCYCINKHKDTDYDGMYSNGTWSYMGDPSTIIMYIVGNQVTSDFATTPKIARQCVFFNDEDLIINARVYPVGDGNPNTRREFRAYAQQFISELFGLPNNWAVKETEWEESAVNGFMSYQLIQEDPYFVGYADPKHFEMSFSLNKARDAFAENAAPKKIVYGHKAYCPICGDPFTSSERYVCESCDENRPRCAGCGESYDQEDLYYCADTEDYRCGDCCTYCDYYEEYYSDDETEFYTVHRRTRYGMYSETWCEDAVHNYATECEDCDEIWHEDDVVLVYDEYGNEKYVCPHCADSYTECSDCGDMYEDSVLKEFVDPETGEVKMLCPSCYEEAMEQLNQNSEVVA